MVTPDGLFFKAQDKSAPPVSTAVHSFVSYNMWQCYSRRNSTRRRSEKGPYEEVGGGDSSGHYSIQLKTRNTEPNGRRYSS
ncbi:hypothetical protein TNCV_885141 [Trichonephila clavipes]|nr:hypothetical protein TNCV_885141 [Trichonephila clavipes]